MSAQLFTRCQTVELGTYIGHPADDGEPLCRAFAPMQHPHGTRARDPR